MAVGSMSSLGLGSGVLTYDVIDSLKEADEESIIKPIDRKIETNTEKQASLASLMTLLGNLKSSSNYLSDTSSYLERSTNVVGEGVSASAGAGLFEQDIEIEVEQLAKTDVYEVSGLKFESRDDTFSTKNSTLSFYHNATEYNIKISAGATVEEVSQSITDATDGEVLGSIMKVGGDKPYQLMINSKEKGAENKIFFGTTIQSDAVIGGAITPSDTPEDDFNITLKDADGNDVTINVTLPETDGANTSSDNALALKEAIEEAIAADASLSSLLFDEDSVDTIDDRNRPIHISLASDGTRLVINDSRGEDITVGGGKAELLGFDAKTESKTNSVTGAEITTYGAIDINFTIGDTTYDFTTTEGNSPSENAQEIVDAINASPPTGITASLDSENNSIILTQENGDDVSIIAVGADDAALSESKRSIAKVGFDSGTYTSEKNFLQSTLELDNMQVAQNSKFRYNDIEMTRSGNYIDDIISGLSITLEKVHDDGDSSIISVTQNSDQLAEEIESFIKTYNESTTMLNELTKYDPDTGISGLFQGQSEINTIRGKLNNILLFSDSQNRSLVSLGVYLNEDGTLEYDKEKLSEKIKGDPEMAEELFRGYTGTVNGQEKEFDGVFMQFTSYLEGLLVDGPDGDALLKSYETSLEDELETLNESRKKEVKFLDTKYELMAMRFASYDSIIADIENSFSSLQMQIEAMANS